MTSSELRSRHRHLYQRRARSAFPTSTLEYNNKTAQKQIAETHGKIDPMIKSNNGRNRATIPLFSLNSGWKHPAHVRSTHKCKCHIILSEKGLWETLNLRITRIPDLRHLIRWQYVYGILFIPQSCTFTLVRVSNRPESTRPQLAALLNLR